MKLKQKYFILFIFFTLCFGFVFINSNTVVKADSLSDSINEQINKIDFTQLENFFNSIVRSQNFKFNAVLNKILNGEYNVNYIGTTEYIFNIAFNKVYNFMPTLVSILAISILCGVFQQLKNSFLTEGVAEITFFVCIMGIILILSSQIISMWENTQITIKNIAKLTEIMSPIILTLMVAVGGNISASVYTPTVAFLSNGVIAIIQNVVLPLIGIMTIFNIASNFSSQIKLNKFSDFIIGVIKWTFGIIMTIYGLFLSVQGFASASFDGISIKAAKYALSNSIPIVGGFIKDGFDLVLAGSVLIKNSVGILVVFALLYCIVSPVITMAVFSLLLKLIASLTEIISDVRISNFCLSISKTLSYLIACVLVVGVMLFVTVLLMIFSANAFI